MKNLNITKISGFTLMETLIVIAICGIIASIAIPAYQSYKSQARTKELLANMKDVMNSIKITPLTNYITI